MQKNNHIRTTRNEKISYNDFFSFFVTILQDSNPTKTGKI